MCLFLIGKAGDKVNENEKNDNRNPLGAYPSLRTACSRLISADRIIGLFGLTSQVAVFAWAVRIAVIFIFKGSDVMGYSIVWWNGAFGFTLGCIITWTYYLSGRWQKNARVAPAPV